MEGSQAGRKQTGGFPEQPLGAGPRRTRCARLRGENGAQPRPATPSHVPIPRPHRTSPALRPGCRRGLRGVPRPIGAHGPPHAGTPWHTRTRTVSPAPPRAALLPWAARPGTKRCPPRSAHPTNPPAAPHPEPWGRAAPGSPQQHRVAMLAAPPRSLSPPLLSPRQLPHVSH